MDSGTLIPGVEYAYDDYRFSLTVDDSSSEHKAIIASCRNVKSGENGSKNRLVGKSSVVEGWHVYIDENNENDDLIAEIYAIGTFTDTRTPTVLHVDSRQTKTFYEADEIGQPIDFSGLVVGAYLGSVHPNNLWGTIPLEELLFATFMKSISQLTPSDHYTAEESIIQYQGEQFPGVIEGLVTRVVDSSDIVWRNDISFTYDFYGTIRNYEYYAIDTEDGLPKARFFFGGTENLLSQGKVNFYVTYIYKSGTENKNIAYYVYNGSTYYLKGNIGTGGQTRFICGNNDLTQFDDFLNSLSEIEDTVYYTSSKDDLIYIVDLRENPHNIYLCARTYCLQSNIRLQDIDDSLINVLRGTYALDYFTIRLWTGRVPKNVCTVPIRISWNNLYISNPTYIFYQVVHP